MLSLLIKRNVLKVNWGLTWKVRSFVHNTELIANMGYFYTTDSIQGQP